MERIEPFARRLVALLLQRHLLDLELQDATLDDVDLGGHRVDLDAQLAGRFVDEIDRLVGQEAVGEIAVRQDGGGDECRVLDAHPVVHLVPLLQAAQDGDRVLHRWLTDVDLLEPPLEGGVLLDVFAVLVERRGADHPQFTPGEERFDHVAGVHRPFRRAGADDRVQLVDERDDLAFRVGDLLEHGLQPFLELTAVLRAGDQRAHVEGDEALVLETLGNVAVGDAAGEAFDDGGLAHARLTDQHRVVLGASGEHLDDAPDLVVATDDGIDLAVASALGEILPVSLQRLELILGVLAGDAMRAAHVGERLQHLLTAHAEAVVHRQQQVLDGEVVVLEVLLDLLGAVDDGVELAGQVWFVAATGAGELGDRLVGLVLDHQRRLAELAEQCGDDRAVLTGDDGEHVIGGQLRVGVAARQVERGGERLLRLHGPLLGVERHRRILLFFRGIPYRKLHRLRQKS